MPPAQGTCYGVRCGERQHGQHEHLRIPEHVSVVAGAGQAFRRNRPVLAASASLEHVEHAEPHGLLDLDVPVDLDVGTIPEVVEIGPLIGDQAVPAGKAGAAQRGPHLVPHGGQGADTGPAVGYELDHAEPLTWL